MGDMSLEYQSLAIIFIMTTSFAVVFPVGPLLALISVLVTRWSDVYKFCRINHRRPMRVRDVTVTEAWLGVFEAVSYCCVIVNVGVLAVASGDCSVWTAILLEHSILAFKFYLSWSIPDVPEWISSNRIVFQ